MWQRKVGTFRKSSGLAYISEHAKVLMALIVMAQGTFFRSLCSWHRNAGQQKKNLDDNIIIVWRYRCPKTVNHCGLFLCTFFSQLQCSVVKSGSLSLTWDSYLSITWSYSRPIFFVDQRFYISYRMSEKNSTLRPTIRSISTFVCFGSWGPIEDPKHTKVLMALIVMAQGTFFSLIL